MAGTFGEDVHRICKKQILSAVVLFERFGCILKEALLISDGMTDTGLLLLARKTMI